jgi:hypothetical protein
VVRMAPAASWRDFYRQTYRARAARSTLAAIGVIAPQVQERSRLAAFARTAVADPLGACAYVIARIVAVALHRLRPATFRTTWEISPSTKRPVTA